MSLKIVVLAKQVPDTRNVGKDAMTAEGTINRAALPAIFNPEDLNALRACSSALRSAGHLQSGRPQRTGAGSQAERISSGLYRNIADNGARACCRNHP